MILPIKYIQLKLYVTSIFYFSARPNSPYFQPLSPQHDACSITLIASPHPTKKNSLETNTRAAQMENPAATGNLALFEILTNSPRITSKPINWATRLTEQRDW